MPSFSTSDTVTYSTPKENKNQSLTEEPITANKNDFKLIPLDKDRVSGRKKKKWESQKKNKKRNVEERLLMEAPAEEEENNASPSRRSARLEKKRRIELGHDSHLGCTAQTGTSQYRGGVGGGKHVPSHSSQPAISNVPSPPITAGNTLVVQPLPSTTAQTPLPKPAQVPPAPLQPPCQTFHEISKGDCHTPQTLEQHKNAKKHQKNTRVYEKLLQRCNAINEQQSGQVPTSQLKLIDQPKKVQESDKNGCPTHNMASGVIVDNHKKEIQMLNNVGNISEVPALVPEGKTTDNFAARGRGLKRKKGDNYMRTNDGSKRVELSKPVRTEPFTCKLCNVKCELQVDYKSHLNGKKHLHNLRCARDHQASLGADQQAVSGGLLGLQPLKPPEINALSNASNVQDQLGDNNSQALSKPVEHSKAAEIVSLTCELCDLKCNSLADYLDHVNGRKHLHKLRCARDHQASLGAGQQAVSGGLLGLRTLKPPEISTLSNAINAQDQQGDNNPQVLSKTVEHSKPAEIVSFTCELCDLKCNSQADYLGHVNGRKHLYRQRCARNDQVLSGAGQQTMSGGLLGLQTLKPPEINTLSNAIIAQDQQGDNNPRVLSKPVEHSKPAEIVSFTCELCDLKFNSPVSYLKHLNGRKHLYRLRCAHDHQDLLEAGQQAVSGGLSNEIDSQVQQGDNNPQVHSKPAELSKLAKIGSFTCEVCNVKCHSQVHYMSHVKGRGHLHRLKLARDQQALCGEVQQTASGGLLGLQTLYPPDINDLSNAIDAQVQQGNSNSPQVLLAQLLMTVLSKTQGSTTAPVTSAMAAELPAPSSMAGQSSESQLSQTQVSEITAHVEMENPSSKTN